MITVYLILQIIDDGSTPVVKLHSRWYDKEDAMRVAEVDYVDSIFYVVEALTSEGKQTASTRQG